MILKRVKVVGNIKFDIAPPKDIQNKAKQLQHSWGEERLVLIAASTHQGEDEIILKAFANIQKMFRIYY